uniref:MAM domain-containing protein n=1 Tax=Lepisosteus oculatus TaxID=7918 RepID=W5LYY5_LEPOC
WFMAVAGLSGVSDVALLVSPNMQQAAATCEVRLRYFVWDSEQQETELFFTVIYLADRTSWVHREDFRTKRFQIAGLDIIPRVALEFDFRKASGDESGPVLFSGLSPRNPKPKPDSCPGGSTACRRGGCVRAEQVCDGTDDCGDGSDESEGLCGHYRKCDFESGTCEWSQGEESNLSWSRINQTQTYVTFDPQAGPGRDHTLNMAAGHFLYISSPMSDGAHWTHLHSPVLEPTNSTHPCTLVLYAHLFGPRVGVLSVLILTPKSLKPVWHKDGNHGDLWFKGQVDIVVNSTFQVLRVRGCVKANCKGVVKKPPPLLPKIPPHHASCEVGQFECAKGGCVQQDRVCDFALDCPDGSDEAECGNTSFETSSRGWTDLSVGTLEWTVTTYCTAQIHHMGTSHTPLCMCIHIHTNMDVIRCIKVDICVCPVYSWIYLWIFPGIKLHVRVCVLRDMHRCIKVDRCDYMYVSKCRQVGRCVYINGCPGGGGESDQLLNCTVCKYGRHSLHYPIGQALYPRFSINGAVTDTVKTTLAGMYRPPAGSLSVKLRWHSDGAETVLWTRRGAHGNTWHLGNCPIAPSSGNFQLVLEALRDGYDGRVAVDDVMVLSQPCPAHTSCSFDASACEFSSTGAERWVRQNRVSGSISHGPETDHSLGTETGTTLVFFGDVTYVAGGPNQSQLLALFFHILSLSPDKIRLELGSPVQLFWSRSSSEITGAKESERKLVFEAEGAGGVGTHIAIDDITFSPHSCPEPASVCDFERGMCSWTNTQNPKLDQLDWDWTSTEVERQYPTPPHDHSLGTVHGHFLFLPSSPRETAGQKAWLLSPHLPPTRGTCLRFWAYRNPLSEGRLRVVLLSAGEAVELFRVEGAEQWTRYDVLIRSEREYQIVFEGVKGHSGVQALDDIIYTPGVNCPGEQPDPPSSAEPPDSTAGVVASIIILLLLLATLAVLLVFYLRHRQGAAPSHTPEMSFNNITYSSSDQTNSRSHSLALK